MREFTLSSRHLVGLIMTAPLRLLPEPDSNGEKGNKNNNYASIMNPSQVQLFAAVGSLTDEPFSGSGLSQMNRTTDSTREVLASNQPCLPCNLKK